MQHHLEELSREAEEVVRKIGLPPCPAILASLVREMRNDDPDFAKLTQLIGGDVTLAAALLKTVNSPFYGLRTKVASIKHALTLLGLRTVTHIVTGLLLRQAFAGVAAHMEEFWERSAGNARGSACLARRVKGFDPDEAYTFALFRDCGIPPMVGGYAGYKPEEAAPRAGQAVTWLENERHGMNHALMGSYLAKSWLLPDTVHQAVLWHHEYAALADGSAGVPEPVVRLVALGLAGEEVYSRQVMGMPAPEWAEHAPFVLKQLKLDEDGLEQISQDAAAELGGR